MKLNIKKIDKQLFFFNFVPSWIIILMPALLISGPFLSDLGLSLVAILFLINSIKNNLIRYYNNYYFKIFLIFCFILILSSLLSENILISLKKICVHLNLFEEYLNIWKSTPKK